MQDQIIVAVFPSRQILVKALDHMLEEAAVDVRKAAVVTKTRTGKVLVLNDNLTGDDGGLLGGIVGGIVAAVGMAVLGAFTLPGLNLLLVMLAGALLGGTVGWFVGLLIAKTFNFGFARDIVESIAERLHEGQPALMLHVSDAAELLPKLQEELKPFKAEVVERLKEMQSRIQH